MGRPTVTRISAGAHYARQIRLFRPQAPRLRPCCCGGLRSSLSWARRRRPKSFSGPVPRGGLQGLRVRIRGGQLDPRRVPLLAATVRTSEVSASTSLCRFSPTLRFRVCEAPRPSVRLLRSRRAESRPTGHAVLLRAQSPDLGSSELHYPRHDRALEFVVGQSPRSPG